MDFTIEQMVIQAMLKTQLAIANKSLETKKALNAEEFELVDDLIDVIECENLLEHAIQSHEEENRG